MTIRVNWWDEEQSIVLYRFIDCWTWDELYRAFDEASVMETSVPHRVDMIVDLTLSGHIPYDALVHIKRIADIQPPNAGLTVLVSPSHLVQSLYDAGVKLHTRIGEYFRVVRSVEDAERLITESRRKEDSARHV